MSLGTTARRTHSELANLRADDQEIDQIRLKRIFVPGLMEWAGRSGTQEGGKHQHDQGFPMASRPPFPTTVPVSGDLMTHPGDAARLGHGPAGMHPALVTGQSRRQAQLLNRDLAHHQLVLSPSEHPHAAAAQLAEQPVPARDEPRLKRSTA